MEDAPDRELLHIVGKLTDPEISAEVFVYSYDSMLSLRRAICKALKVPHCSLMFKGYETQMHHTLQEAGLENHSEVQVVPVSEVALASASADGMVFIWDAIGGKCLETLRGHNSSAVHCCSFSITGRLLGTTSVDCAKVWETSTGQCHCTLKGHKDWVVSIGFDAGENLAITASLDCSARLWDLVSARCVQVFPGGVSPIFWVSFDPDGDQMEVATASADGTATIWKHSGEVQQVLQGHEDNVLMVTYSANSKRLLTASQDRTARMWEALSGMCLREFRGHTDTVQSAFFSGDGRLCVTGSMDRTARIWETKTGDCLRTLSGHAGSVLFALFSADAGFVATAARDGCVRTYDSKTGRLQRLLEGHHAKVNTLSFVSF